MMQAHSGQRTPSSEPAGGSQRPGIGRRLGRHLAIVAVAASGLIAGSAIGWFSFWADPIERVDEEAWSWQLPALPAEIEPAYRRQCEEAGRAVTEVLTAFPDSPDAVSALAILFYLAHDTRGEKTCWERCLTLDPDNDFAHSRLFTLAEQEADYPRMVDMARAVETRNPQNVAYRGQLGSALMNLQRNVEARDMLERHVSAGFGDAETYFVLGEVCFQLDDPRKAKRYFEAAAALAPYDSAKYFSLAKACAKLGETELATRYRARFQESRNAETAARQGDASSRQQVRDEVHVPIRVAEIMQHIGRAYRDADLLALAEKSWLRGIELNPDNTASQEVLRELLSDLYLRQGRLEDALACVRELKRIAPQNRLHERNEGLMLSRLERYDEAERVFRELCRRDPMGSFGYAALAQLLLLRGGDVREAQSLARRAVEFAPTGENLYLLALAAQQTGDLPTVRAAIGQALALDPDNQQYRRLYASLSNQR